MTFLPIVARELRIASRRRSTYWLRSAAALVVLMIAAWFFLVARDQPPHQISMVLFGLLTGGAGLYCLFSGVRYTADCLSEEKRDGTLGLLFLTDLKGYDVVFGKLVANSLSSLYGVLAVVPMLALPLLLGGVTPGEFGRMALVTLNTLFFSLAAGICVSSLCRSARHAMGMTLLLILLLAAVLPAFGAWLAFVAQARQVPVAFLMPSPGFSYALAFDQLYKSLGRGAFWWSLLLIHGMGWLFLTLASVIAPRTWQDRPAGTQQLRWKERLRGWSYGNSAERAAFRRRLLDKNAFFWLVSRARLKPVLVWVVLALLAGGWAWGLAKYRHEWLNSFIYLTTGILLNLLMKGWVASETGRQFAEDRTHGALDARPTAGPEAPVLWAADRRPDRVCHLHGGRRLGDDVARRPGVMDPVLDGPHRPDDCRLDRPLLGRHVAGPHGEESQPRHEREPGPHHGHALGRVCRGEPPVIAGFLEPRRGPGPEVLPGAVGGVEPGGGRGIWRVGEAQVAHRVPHRRGPPLCAGAGFLEAPVRQPPGNRRGRATGHREARLMGRRRRNRLTAHRPSSAMAPPRLSSSTSQIEPCREGTQS